MTDDLMLPAHIAQEPTLHPDTESLVQRFAAAMREKLAKAENKYGYSNLWKNPDWMNECRAKLVEHLHKGDPLDVANYCAFLWHHGEHCKPVAQEPVAFGVREEDGCGGVWSWIAEWPEAAHEHINDAIDRYLGEVGDHPPKYTVVPLYTAPPDLAAEVERLRDLRDRLTQQAQIHAQEARTANSTIAEIYQCVSGATGEPGNWHGATPVRERIAEVERQRNRLVTALQAETGKLVACEKQQKVLAEALEYLEGHVDPHVQFIANTALASVKGNAALTGASRNGEASG